MIKTMKQVFRVRSAMSVNRFLFWAGKLPLIKRLFPARLYGATAAKGRLMAVVEAFSILFAFGGKFVYLFFCCWCPALLLGEVEELSVAWPMFVSILFFLSFLMGSFLASDALSPTLIKYTCVRQMGMEARACVAATTGWTHVLTFLTFTPALITAAVLSSQPWWYGALLSLELAACRCLGERLHLWIFERWGRPISDRTWYVILCVVLGLGLAYGPAALKVSLPMDRFLFNGAVAVVLLLGGVWAAVSLLRYPSYRDMICKTCRPEKLSSAAAKANAAQSTFRDVQMKDGDLRADDSGAKFRNLKGYAYLNALFFRRHQRLLIRPMWYELIGIGAAFVGLAAASLLFREKTAEALEGLPKLLPMGVFLMYCLCSSLGTRMCKAMFYNCDISLLRFGWYRERKVLLRNFTIRLGQITRVNLTVAAALCVTLAAGVLLSGAALPPGELVPFFLSILLLAVLFSVHPLFLYYVFQPYTTQLAVKNPFFSWINGIMYFVCMMCAQIKQPPEFFGLLVLGATLLYILAALLMVWRRAPKTFRVK